MPNGEYIINRAMFDSEYDDYELPKIPEFDRATRPGIEEILITYGLLYSEKTVKKIEWLTQYDIIDVSDETLIKHILFAYLLAIYNFQIKGTEIVATNTDYCGNRNDPEKE